MTIAVYRGRKATRVLWNSCTFKCNEISLYFQRYMAPLKTLSSIDETVIDNIFYMIPEILMHHVIYHEFLNDVWTKWNTDTSTVGDIIQNAVSPVKVSNMSLSDCTVKFLKIRTPKLLYYLVIVIAVMLIKDAEEMANSVDLDHNAPSLSSFLV